MPTLNLFSGSLAQGHSGLNPSYGSLYSIGRIMGTTEYIAKIACFVFID